jgi:Relaxase/Mobilisation nuclease domain/Large polyvalent protein-associated domain 7
LIAKRVTKKANTSSISVLAGYIVGLPETRQPQDWPPLINYITDAVSDGARVDFVRVTNLPSDELRDAVLAMMITQDMNTRSKSDKTYHMIFSFPHGEKPNREILNDIEDNLVASIGLKDHQRISAAHDDKEHYHVHVAINKVHPKTFRNVEPFYDKNALMRTCSELEKKHGLIITNHGKLAEAQAHNREANFESQSNIQSLHSWINSNAKEQLIEAFETSKSWGEFHEKANELGLELKLRGAGLVIKAVGQEVAVKASSVDRGLSFKSLTSKFGEFEAPSQALQKALAIQTYTQSPIIDKAASVALFAQFQTQRVDAIAKRRDAKEELRNNREMAAQVIKTAFETKRTLIKNNRLLGRLNKKLEYQKLALERSQIWQIHKNSYAKEKMEIEKSNPLLTWNEFLQSEVKNGNDKALEVLRANKRSKDRFSSNIIDCENVTKAKNIILKDMIPIVRKNGEIIYFVKDGGKVLDTGKSVNVEAVSTGAAFLALSLAQEKFEGRALRINGSDAFKREIVMVAASKDFGIRFADKAMNDAVDILRTEKSKDKAHLSEFDHAKSRPLNRKIKPVKRGR